MRRLLALALVAVAALLVAPRPAHAQEDPFSPQIRAAMGRQDQLTDAGQLDQAVAEARSGLRQPTQEAYYLLGRALGNLALHFRRAGLMDEYRRTLDDARDAFGKSKERGGLLYAPPLLGLARCARLDEDLSTAEGHLRQALRVAPHFKEANLELVQVLWQRRLHADAELEAFRLLERQPDYTEARLLLASLKSARGRWSEAERELHVVVQQEPGHHDARRLLAIALIRQEKWQDAARELERLRRTLPSDTDAYVNLFSVYRQMDEREKATALLRDLIQNAPGTDAADRAKNTLEAIENDPGFWDTAGELTPERLVAQLDSRDRDVQARALSGMRAYDWNALPPAVYRLLGKAVPPHVRRNAVLLMGDVADVRTLPILEILLFHPTERDADPQVRRVAARAIALMPTDATLPILYRLLDEGDLRIREWGVRGLATRTGKWFRPELARRHDGEDWAAERAMYGAWWNSSTGSLVKRDAMVAMREVFGELRRGRARLGEYALHGLDDSNERTWRAGYGLFQALTGQTFGSPSGPVPVAERRRIAAAAREWLRANGER